MRGPRRKHIRATARWLSTTRPSRVCAIVAMRCSIWVITLIDELHNAATRTRCGRSWRRALGLDGSLRRTRIISQLTRFGHPDVFERGSNESYVGNFGMPTCIRYRHRAAWRALGNHVPSGGDTVREEVWTRPPSVEGPNSVGGGNVWFKGADGEAPRRSGSTSRDTHGAYFGDRIRSRAGLRCPDAPSPRGGRTLPCDLRSLPDCHWGTRFLDAHRLELAQTVPRHTPHSWRNIAAEEGPAAGDPHPGRGSSKSSNAVKDTSNRGDQRPR